MLAVSYGPSKSANGDPLLGAAFVKQEGLIT